MSTRQDKGKDNKDKDRQVKKGGQMDQRKNQASESKGSKPKKR